MKTNHKGYVIDVSREKCLGGWNMLYVSVIREEDGLEIICFTEDSAEKVKDMTRYMKNRVDEFIETKGRSEELEEYY